ncbi:MAG: helix-turn-helix transcriptional regulator [Candidatus Nanopelagicales bacterium]|nr:helix-turn-helix transcriptional regulator [Candidatus Nanopelagicales bacterium]
MAYNAHMGLADTIADYRRTVRVALQARIDAGATTQGQVSRSLGCSQSAISQWLSDNDVAISIEKIDAIAELLNLGDSQPV